MKTLILTAACAASLALTGCASSKLLSGDVVGNADTLKEVNRHLELCSRTYAWPFTATITCNPAPAAPPSALTAAEIAAIVSAAVAKALPAAGPPPFQ